MSGPFTFATVRWPSAGRRGASGREVEADVRRQRRAQEQVNAKTWGMGCNE